MLVKKIGDKMVKILSKSSDSNKVSNVRNVPKKKNKKKLLLQSKN